MGNAADWFSSLPQLSLGFPRFSGQVDKGHAMTTRLSIDDQPIQNTPPVHSAAEAGGH
jgi:hypothetical protein